MKVSKIDNDCSEEARNFDFSSAGGDTYMLGNVKFIWTEYHCPRCGQNYTIDEIDQIGKSGLEKEGNPPMLCHPIEPVYDKNSKILILGSFPSVKSREEMFFYGHPQNRFWRVLAAVFGRPIPRTVEEKRALLLEENVALWDVIASCEIVGSSDSSIKNVVPNDLRQILDTAQIRKIFVNGKAAEKYYRRYLLSVTGREAVCLPSTSPANAAWSLERLADAWRLIRP